MIGKKQDPEVTICVLEKIFGKKYKDFGDYILPMLSKTRYHKIAKLVVEKWMKVTNSCEYDSLTPATVPAGAFQVLDTLVFSC